MTNDWHVVQLETPRVRAEWHGKEGGIYRVRVRSRVCGGFGVLSAYVTQGMTDPRRRVPEPTKPEQPEECPTIDDYPVGNYRARVHPVNCEPVCPAIDLYRSRMTAPETTCPPEPCQTQTYYPSMTQQPTTPCVPPCEQLSLDVG